MDLDVFLMDLAGRFDAERRVEADALVDELTDAERSSVTMAARLLAMEGEPLTLLLRGGERVRGRVVDVARTWVLVGTDPGQSLIPLGALAAVWPLGGAVADESSVAHSVGVGHVLRELGDRGVEIVVDHDAGIHVGVVAAMLADHLDLDVATGGSVVDARDRVGRIRLSLPLAGVRRIRISAS